MPSAVHKLDAIALWQPPLPCACSGADANDYPRLTPFLPEVRRSRGAIIVCPGGAYAYRAAHEGVPVAQWVSSLGIAAFVLDYRVSPHHHPEPLRDIQRAIRMVRANASTWGVDPAHVGMMGFSAGGHLVVSAGTMFDAGDPNNADPIERQSCRPDFIVACYPLITLGPYGYEQARYALLGEKPSRELVEYMSLENRIIPQTPPTFIWQTADDAALPVENSLLLARSLRRNKVPFELHIFPHGRHGLALAEDAPDVARWKDLCAAWLKSQGL